MFSLICQDVSLFWHMVRVCVWSETIIPCGWIRSAGICKVSHSKNRQSQWSLRVWGFRVVCNAWLKLSCCSWEHQWYLGFALSLSVVSFECNSDVGNGKQIVRIDACEHVAGYVLDRVPPFTVCNGIVDCVVWSFLVRRTVARCFVKLVCN